MSVGKYMFPSCLASFLAEAVVTTRGEFISWLWPSQPPVGMDREAGALES